ncbi:MAG: SMC family ATPase, partial [Nitrososphaerota archaeon]|nr:SMC family ATPase [Nitrososphaerota archaeon]
MMLKSLTLQNFRSYGDAPVKIDFDRGILLFEGDIGSGKSSILYAIEFAFFGLGDVEGRFMLRGSSPSARVELEFEVGNTEYKIVRTIERRKGTGAVQTRGWISESGGKEEELKPTEMRSRILQILSFREKPGKSSSRIYRFAVFTPQEFMKEVLNQRPDERIETLRRAFGIEDYSFASSNAKIVIPKIENIAKIYAEVSKSLPAKEESLRKANESLKKNELELATSKRKLEEIDLGISEIQSTLSVLEKERDEARKLQIVLPQLETTLLQLKSQYTDGRKQLERYEANQKEMKLAKIALAKLKPEYEKFLEAKKKLQNLEDLQEKYQDLEKRIADLNGT